jgi:(1->4)-alpha-D-glucan 1-alpha-D-glucosylmutase
VTATYRLQLHSGFTFGHARAVLPYLAELGITHLYLSPVLQAAKGSTHGYDVVDPERVSAALGGEAAFDELVAAADTHGLEILLDIVPNHMSIAGADNHWWFDMLENGPASYYAQFFDIDWSGDSRVALPVLTERYGRALSSGHLGIVHDGAGGFAIRAGDLRLPIAPRTLGPIVRRAGERIQHAELAFIGDALAGLPRETSAETRRRRHRDKAVLARQLAALCEDRRCAAALDHEVASLGIDHVELDAILELQAYRLVHWSVAQDQLSYRRFFDISTLVGVRNELPEVFAATHGKILEWLADGSIAGVRIDHVDGLRDPIAYLQRLRAHAPAAWIVVEKIVGTDETLPRWSADGTTGYEFAERVGAMLVDPANEAAMTHAFEELTGMIWNPAVASREARHEVMADALHSELTRLVDLAVRACAASSICRDFTRVEIETALRELFAGYSTYRTYFGGVPRPEDRARLGVAAAAVPPAIDRDLLDFLEAALAFEVNGTDALELAHVAQQSTGAIVAKGDEDTLSYRHVRLASRCEVGADLSVFGLAPAELHRMLAAGAPKSLLATSTHDTKRGEDVRARIAALSEIPAVWTEAVKRWRAKADGYWGEIADHALEYLMWQVIVGAWPLTEERAREYMRKAAREARLRTSWRAPDERYEAAIDRWCTGVFGDIELQAELGRFVAKLAPRGDANSLAQLLIKLAAPGVPDIYQGSELVDASLVDPDNRRPVDYDERRRRLSELADATGPPKELGLAKLWTIRRALGLRRKRPELFAGAYAALEATGPRADRVFAFRRGDALIAAVPRLGPADGDTRIALPAGTWTDVLSDRTMSGTVDLVELWAAFPVALLVRS